MPRRGFLQAVRHFPARAVLDLAIRRAAEALAALSAMGADISLDNHCRRVSY
jgi:hypothetical protein